jgi:hypothetical protein
MASYRFLVQQPSGYFEGCEFPHVPRADNEAADTLSRIGSTRQDIPPGLALEHLCKPSIKPSLESESIFIEADPGEPTSSVPGAAGSTPTAGSSSTSGCPPAAQSPDPGAPQLAHESVFSIRHAPG